MPLVTSFSCPTRRSFGFSYCLRMFRYPLSLSSSGHHLSVSNPRVMSLNWPTLRSVGLWYFLRTALTCLPSVARHGRAVSVPQV